MSSASDKHNPVIEAPPASSSSNFKFSIVHAIVLAIALAIFLISVAAVKRQVKLNSRALSGVAVLSLSPAISSVPPDSPLSVMVNTGLGQVGFVRVDLSFDPAQLRLATEITTTPLLKTVIQKTSMAQANSTGKISIVLGLSTDDTANPPSGSFELANLTFAPANSTVYSQQLVDFDPTLIQIVNMSSTIYGFNTTPATIYVNSALKPTITNTPTPTKKGGPKPTVTKKPGPRKTPTPTP